MSEQDAPQDAPQDLDTVHAALQEDGVYVHPQLERFFTRADLAAIEENVAEAEFPVYVVAWPFEENDEFGGSTVDLLTRLHDAHPEPGTYLATTTQLRPDEYTEIVLEGRQWDVPGTYDGDVDYAALGLVRYEEPATLGEAFARATELQNLPPEEVDALYDEAYAAYREDQPAQESTGSDDGGYPGGRDDEGFDPTGLLVAGLVLALVLAAVGLLRRRRPQLHDGAFVLPPSAMSRIRAAHDQQLLDRARREVLDLGEAIDAAEITRRGNTSAWQAALDHYDAAGRELRGDEPDVLDVVGAIVLAERGQGALRSALAGRAWSPERPCFLHPLHGPATAHRPVEREDGTVKAPLCRACDRALSGGRRPEILDVVRRGEPVHYFDAPDASPWAETGYGALDTDLVRRLHRRA